MSSCHFPAVFLKLVHSSPAPGWNYLCPLDHPLWLPLNHHLFSLLLHTLASLLWKLQGGTESVSTTKAAVLQGDNIQEQRWESKTPPLTPS